MSHSFFTFFQFGRDPFLLYSFIYYFFYTTIRFSTTFSVSFLTLFDKHQNYRWKHTRVHYRTFNSFANIKYRHAHSKWTLWMSIQWNAVTLKRENWDHFLWIFFKDLWFQFNMGLMLRETRFLSFWRFLKFFHQIIFFFTHWYFIPQTIINIAKTHNFRFVFNKAIWT